MRKKGKIKKLVLVDWVDSCSLHGWVGEGAYDNKLVLCKTAGWLLKKNKTAMTVVATRSNDKHYTCDITIPMACVKKIREI